MVTKKHTYEFRVSEKVKTINQKSKIRYKILMRKTVNNKNLYKVCVFPKGKRFVKWWRESFIKKI